MGVYSDKMIDSWPMTSSRFNAHLTFNLLNSVQGLLLDHQPEQAFDLINRYSRILRGMLVNGTMVTTLGEEMAIITDYLEIEKVRSDCSFRYSIRIDPCMERLNVPKSLLISLVENALKHGIRRMGGMGTIAITGRLSGPTATGSGQRAFFSVANTAPDETSSPRLGSERVHGFGLLSELTASFHEVTGTPVTFSLHESPDGEGTIRVEALVTVG
jgi:LytS/YehU family sensor histidine kinase